MAPVRKTSSLRVAVTDGRGRPWPSASLGRWLARHGPARARGTVTIALVSDPAMRRLNAKFRGADYATDVLSFSSDIPGDLGDIAIARGVAARQARRLGHSESTELKTLALHGLLHRSLSLSLRAIRHPRHLAKDEYLRPTSYYEPFLTPSSV